MTESPFRAKTAPTTSMNGATRLPARRDDATTPRQDETPAPARAAQVPPPASTPRQKDAPAPAAAGQADPHVPAQRQDEPHEPAHDDAAASGVPFDMDADFPDFLGQFVDWQTPDARPAQQTTTQQAEVSPVEDGAPQARTIASPQLLRPRPLEPTSGPRRWVHAMTGGLVNLGPSAAQLREQERMARIQRPLRGAHVTTYLCLKGGITKTTTCIGTALTAAQYRPEAVVAGDFNPDAGDLAERVTGREGLAGVNQLAQHVDSVTSIGDLSRYLYSEGRLTVLPGEPDPKLGESLTSAQFNAVIEILSSYYSSIHVDAGTGITHPIMPGILARTDTLVVPAAYSITGAKRAYETLAWLRSNGFGRLASSAIVALTERDLVSREVDKNAVLAMFEGIPVVKVPADRHLADGAQVHLEQMQPRTREAFAEIAALIADRYPA